MLDDKDVQKLIKAFKDVFPTAEMVQECFAETAKKTDLEKLAAKEQLEKLEIKVDRINERLKNVEVKLETIEDLRPRVKTLEEAMGIE
ncbi:MAG: hypothetical protein A2908_00710 [Candidatus Staskawiczbacteria bacterium RIFCSPLOWO2_01_FULL_38_12b]|uniref:Uncharacterized protein n=1 Tax=Candidatus Staskawiczbacteria bacterium RIFCSPLOWO2_01_FULL_38_12b TaxID=1802214 RepID=A0A1G2IFU2_9BACT|nr:MAG: hypothetical protein A2908_00710 [Candidatus Staskawiczbacteria bacterium RIFCSPLOWO2_01_FULL_38_12b]